MTKEEKGVEIEILKKKVDDLSKEINKYISKQTKKLSSNNSLSKKENRGYVKLLVILIVVLIIVDILSLVAYYKPDFSKIIKSNTANTTTNNKQASSTKCSDGTAESTCSKNKPFYCYNKALVKSASNCGCPTGYKQDFQDCVKA
jgi:cytoskeletal protein RodZ